MAKPRDDMRAADADRTAVGERLRAALDEGRLDFHEYDTRLRDAYAAKTYGELRRLIDDLPATRAAPPASAAQSQLVPTRSSAPVPVASGSVTRRWLREVWSSWASVTAITTGIWLVVAIFGGTWYPWPMWVAGPWGVVLLVQTVGGLSRGEPQRWAARKERRRTAKVERRLRKREGRTSP